MSVATDQSGRGGEAGRAGHGALACGPALRLRALPFERKLKTSNSKNNKKKAPRLVSPTDAEKCLRGGRKKTPHSFPRLKKQIESPDLPTTSSARASLTGVPRVRNPPCRVKHRRLQQPEDLPRNADDQGIGHQPLRPRAALSPALGGQALGQAEHEVGQPVAQERAGLGETADWPRKAAKQKTWCTAVNCGERECSAVILRLGRTVGWKSSERRTHRTRASASASVRQPCYTSLLGARYVARKQNDSTSGFCMYAPPSGL